MECILISFQIQGETILQKMTFTLNLRKNLNPIFTPKSGSYAIRLLKLIVQVKKIKELKSFEKEFKEKQKSGWLDKGERKEYIERFEKKKQDANKAKNKIEKITEDANVNNLDPVKKIIKRVEEKEESLEIKSVDLSKTANGRPKFRTDNISTLSKEQRKFLGKIFTIIRGVLDKQTSENLIRKNRRGVKMKSKPNVDTSPFDKFQLEEYKNISTSHYESVKQVSAFFRYYLLIVGAPAFILYLLRDKDEGLSIFLSGESPESYYTIASVYLIAIAFVGLFTMLYIVNLRHDAVLYAHTVNKVRRYFYEKSSIPITDYSNYKHLPISTNIPKYAQKTFFIPLIAVFVIINCGLFSAGLYIKSLSPTPYFFDWSLVEDISLSSKSIGILCLGYLLAHIITFLYLVERRNNKYLKSYRIGIDIDGVLNNQTHHFY